jgi:hypothetical protein
MYLEFLNKIHLPFSWLQTRNPQLTKLNFFSSEWDRLRALYFHKQDAQLNGFLMTHLSTRDVVFTHNKTQINVLCPLVYICPFPVHFNLTIPDLISHLLFTLVSHFNFERFRAFRWVKVKQLKISSMWEREGRRKEIFVVVDGNPAVNFDSKSDRVCVFLLRYIRQSSSLNGHHQVIVIAELR